MTWWEIKNLWFGVISDLAWNINTPVGRTFNKWKCMPALRLKGEKGTVPLQELSETDMVHGRVRPIEKDR